MSVSEREKIIQRIKKLKAHAQSAASFGSKEEAAAFAAKYQELMDEYNLSMSEVDAAAEITKDEFHNWVYGESISYHESATDYRWRRELVGVLCRFNFTSFTFKTRKDVGNRTFRVYGNADNVDNVVWLYHYLSIGLFRLASVSFLDLDKVERQRYGRYQYLKDFLYGAVDGIYHQLDEQRKAHAQANNLYALMRTNGEALQRFQAKAIGKVTPAKPIQISVGEAYHTGKEAGKKFNIGKPIEAGKTTKNSVKKLK